MIRIELSLVWMVAIPTMLASCSTAELNPRQLAHAERIETLLFSPDDEWIAYAAREGSKTALFVSRRDGSERRQLLVMEGVGSLVGWSPDGRRILAHVSPHTGHGSRYDCVEVATGEVLFTINNREKASYLVTEPTPDLDGFHVWRNWGTPDQAPKILGWDGKIHDLADREREFHEVVSPAIKRRFVGELLKPDPNEPSVEWGPANRCVCWGSGELYAIWSMPMDRSERKLVARLRVPGWPGRSVIKGVSPDGKYLYLESMLQHQQDLGRHYGFNRFISTDGRIVRDARLQGWATAGRAVVKPDDGEWQTDSLELLSLDDGVRTLLVRDEKTSINDVVTSNDGAFCAYVGYPRQKATLFIRRIPAR